MNTIKFCAKCGAPIGPEEKFCGGCGASIAEMEAEAGISTQQAAPAQAPVQQAQPVLIPSCLQAIQSPRYLTRGTIYEGKWTKQAKVLEYMGGGKRTFKGC